MPRIVDDDPFALSVGLVAGVAATMVGVSPTGWWPADLVVLAGAAGAAVWSASAAPWPVVAIPAVTATALVADRSLLFVVAAWFACLLGLLALRPVIAKVGRRRWSAVTVGSAVIALGAGREVGGFAVGSGIAVGAVVLVALAGLAVRPRPHRRRFALATLTVAVIAGLAVAGIAFSVGASRTDLTVGEQAARDGLAALRHAEFDEARDHFERSADAFERAEDRIGSIWGQAARFVPVIGQQRRAGLAIVSGGAETARTLQRELAAIDVERLGIIDGRIDLDEVAALSERMAALQRSLERFDARLVEVRSGWLLDRIERRIDRLGADIAEQRALGDEVENALAVAPRLLGADGEQVYLVMFTTPAEARGSGGFMGNFAEITIDDGRIAITRFGRHTDLTDAAAGDLTLTDPPADWLARYGPQGFTTGVDGPVADAWMIINLSPHFPSTAAVAADLYPQSGGKPVDGVLSLDVYTLERLIGLLGPVPVGDGDLLLDGTNTAQYLLVDQYETEVNADNAQRVDGLSSIARTVTEMLLTDGSPDPIALGRAMIPMIEQRRLLGWIRDPEGQALISSIGMDGALLGDLDGRDGMSVVVVNDGASKMDTYLRRRMWIEPTETGDLVTVKVRHAPPIEVLPPRVVGATSGLPRGWARLWVTFNTNRPVGTVTVNDEPVSVTSSVEAGIRNYAVMLELPPGVWALIRYEVLGAASPEGLVIEPQPLVVPERWIVDGVEVPGIEARTTARGG